VKQERRIRKKDKEVQRERWKEIEKEMEGNRLTSRKNLNSFRGKGREGGGSGLLTAKLSAESVFVSIFCIAEMHLLR
jgi:hypothetical protein